MWRRKSNHSGHAGDSEDEWKEIAHHIIAEITYQSFRLHSIIIGVNHLSSSKGRRILDLLEGGIALLEGDSKEGKKGATCKDLHIT